MSLPSPSCSAMNCFFFNTRSTTQQLIAITLTATTTRGDLTHCRYLYCFYTAQVYNTYHNQQTIKHCIAHLALSTLLTVLFSTVTTLAVWSGQEQYKHTNLPVYVCHIFGTLYRGCRVLVSIHFCKSSLAHWDEQAECHKNRSIYVPWCISSNLLLSQFTVHFCYDSPWKSPCYLSKILLFWQRKSDMRC